MFSNSQNIFKYSNQGFKIQNFINIIKKINGLTKIVANSENF